MARFHADTKWPPYTCAIGSHLYAAATRARLLVPVAVRASPGSSTSPRRSATGAAADDHETGAPDASHGVPCRLPSASSRTGPTSPQLPPPSLRLSPRSPCAVLLPCPCLCRLQHRAGERHRRSCFVPSPSSTSRTSPAARSSSTPAGSDALETRAPAGPPSSAPSPPVIPCFASARPRRTSCAAAFFSSARTPAPRLGPPRPPSHRIRRPRPSTRRRRSPSCPAPLAGRSPRPARDPEDPRRQPPRATPRQVPLPTPLASRPCLCSCAAACLRPPLLDPLLQKQDDERPPRPASPLTGRTSWPSSSRPHPDPPAQAGQFWPNLRFCSGVVRIRSTTSVCLLHGLVLLPCGISGKMTIPSKSLLSFLASWWKAQPYSWCFVPLLRP
ncbi:uncharacterized protein [Aegilops tauschii subsp. strangulata]|uniref:uncharacterized protein n=1 Tax=Aegilops tauschii subsp. strangulata TaxID=200361 RepID=UPI003CC88A61